jgi:hypothetical protein
MSWYKESKKYNSIITILSYNKLGELAVMFNNTKRYVYPGVSPHLYEKIERLLSRNNSSAVIRILQNLSKTNKKEEEKNRDHTNEEKQEMMNELQERGIL